MSAKKYKPIGPDKLLMVIYDTTMFSYVKNCCRSGKEMSISFVIRSFYIVSSYNTYYHQATKDFSLI